MKDLTGRVVVISGAGSGMGRAYAVEAARRGATLAIHDVDADGLAGTAALLPAGTTVLSQVVDVADRDAVYALAERVLTDLGPADVVINNAGVEGCAKPTWAFTDAEMQRVLDINLWGVVHGTRAFLPQLLTGDLGALVNVSSLFGLVGAPNQADYCASKFAVRGFSEALAAELADTHVRVHLVHPGGIATNIARSEASAGFAGKYLKTSAESVAVRVLDAVGTRRTRIVLGHRAPTTWLGARVLPPWLMVRMIWRDLRPILDLQHYPPTGDTPLPTR
ncbi:SDR family NAD(P)-dependent oxidoreductase [Nocardioides sp.]|uniref:SDR family NAD(P)-dependent oxidoreductase n=1 Tax=Nocardioides sp. TaxID=35761 RepID=UPI00351275A5